MRRTLSVSGPRCREAVMQFIARLRLAGVSVAAEAHDSSVAIAWGDPGDGTDDDDTTCRASIVMEHYMRTLHMLAATLAEADRWFALQGTELTEVHSGRREARRSCRAFSTVSALTGTGAKKR